MENDKYIGVLDGNEEDVKKMDMELCKKFYGSEWKKEFEKIYPNKSEKVKNLAG